MNDTILTISGFSHDAGQIGAWCEQINGLRVEASTAGETVTIHPRPRQLTVAELAALEAVLRASKPFNITADKTTITSDGIDTATVTVHSGEQETEIALDMRGQTVTLPLVDGIGTLEITAEAPTLTPIVVKAVNQAVYGHTQVEVTAL